MGEDILRKVGRYFGIFPLLSFFIILLLLMAIILLISIFPFVYLTQGGIQGIKDWLIPIFGSASIIAVVIGSWLAINEFRLKTETEKIESNVHLLELFSNMMQIAHARYDPIYSEKIVEGLFEKGIINPDDYRENNPKSALIKLNTAILQPVYGMASQDAAIGAIYTLGISHDKILLDAAIEGLKSICSYLKNDLKSLEFNLTGNPKLKENLEFIAADEMYKMKIEMIEKYLDLR